MDGAALLSEGKTDIALNWSGGSVAFRTQALTAVQLWQAPDPCFVPL